MFTFASVWVAISAALICVDGRQRISQVVVEEDMIEYVVLGRTLTTWQTSLLVRLIHEAGKVDAANDVVTWH